MSESDYKKSLPYILLTFSFFLGLGTYFTSLSPFALTHFEERSRLIFLAGQVCFPLGFFLSGYLSDRTRRIRALLTTGLLLQAPCQYLFFSSEDNFAAGLVLGALTRFFLAFNLQLNTLAILEARGESRFGAIRMWGTVAFMLIHLVLYTIDIWAADLFDAAAAGRLAAFFLLLTAIPARWIIPERKSRESYHFRDALRILKQPPVALFYGFSFYFYFHFQIVDLYLGQFLKEVGGMRMVYLAWALVGLVEIPFLPYTAWIARRSGIRALIWLALGAGALRFTMLAASIAGYEPVPVVVSQLLHGLHFAGYYTGALYWLRSTYPDHLFGTGVGLFMLIAAAAGAAAGNLFFGWLLFSDVPVLVTAYTGIALEADQAGYFPIFVLVVVSQIVLTGAFALLRSPPMR